MNMLSLFPIVPPEIIVPDSDASKEIRVLTWNLANPSLARAEKQVQWLLESQANVLLLTEAKESDGCQFIIENLQQIGFFTHFIRPQSKNYNVIIATKGFAVKDLEINFEFMPERCPAIEVQTFLGSLKILGVYVPSRGSKSRRNVDKKKFQSNFSNYISNQFKKGGNNRMIIGGDLNILEPGHFPPYPYFGQWEYDFYSSFEESGFVDAYRIKCPEKAEYSWFGRSGTGYRFDHFFISRALNLTNYECYYIHEPRINKLSDHSAMLIKLINPESHSLDTCLK